MEYNFIVCISYCCNIIFFNLILKTRNSPIIDSSFHLPTNTQIDLQLILGAAIFGIGWGFCGICPGPAIIGLFNYIPHITVFGFMIAVGQYCGYYTNDFIKNRRNKTTFSKFIEA